METGGPSDVGPTQEDKTQAMLCWLLGIVIGVISPVIFMLVGKEKPFVYRNAMQCLTFHLCMIVVWIIVGVLAVVTCGIGAILYLVPFVWSLIVSIMGAMASNSGNVYEPAITGGFAKSWFKV
jgi:uncharacterized membrane protein